MESESNIGRKIVMRVIKKNGRDYYVSCSPYRVPIARLAAAQAAIKYPRA
jgi:hypothetical protein